MADALESRSPLHLALPPGRQGVEGPPGLHVVERVVAGCVSLAARHGGASALAAALRWHLPMRPRCVPVEGGLVVWTGPERWLVFGDAGIAATLRDRIGAAGSLANQGDGRVVLRLTGPRRHDVLARGVSIDLHPRAFAVGDAAATPVAHIPGLLWREDDDSFCLAVPRSFAGSLAEWLTQAARQYGLEVA